MEQYAPIIIPAAAVAISAIIVVGWKFVTKFVSSTENQVDDAVVGFIGNYAGDAVASALKLVVQNTKTPYDNQLLEEVMKELKNNDVDNSTT